MAISLSKGQKISLTKDRAGLSKLRVGLGWDEATNKKVGGEKKGLFGKLASLASEVSTQAIDCDASVFMLNKDGKITSNKSLIYFGNKNSSCNSVIHQGDNLTGAGSGDDEVINVDLSRIPSDIERLVFVVNIYQAKSRKQDFGMIENAFIRILDDSKKEELIRFNLTDNFSGLTSLVVGEIYRNNGEWKFNAIGDGTRDDGLSELSRRYQ